MYIQMTLDNKCSSNQFRKYIFLVNKLSKHGIIIYGKKMYVFINILRYSAFHIYYQECVNKAYN